MMSRVFFSIATADAPALNQRQDLSCVNADLSSAEYVKTCTHKQRFTNLTNAIGIQSNTHILLYDTKGFVSIAVADGLALNPRLEITCATAD